MSKLRLIQCGVGGFGLGWLKEHTRRSPDFELAGIVDISPDNLAKAAEICGLPAGRQFASLEAALDATEADAVLTVTPPPVHVQHARLAFARGLHLMTEKPIAGTIEDAKEMVELARKADRQLTVSQQYRYRPAPAKLRELLKSGVIGELGHGRLEFFIPADFTGSFRETMDFPLLLDMAVHHVDLIRGVTGKNFTRVFAQSFNPPWSWYRHDAGLNMLLELEGGVPFSYTGDWSARGRGTGWNGDWRLQGSEGSLHLTKEEVRLARSEKWQRDETEEIVPLTEPVRADQAETLHQFAEAIRTGVPNQTSGEDNLQTLGTLVAAMTSVRENRPVALAEIL